MSRSLRIEHLSVSYAEKQILQDLSLSISRGEMLALLGPSGCGKSTLLNTLCGFVDADQGRIWLDDEDVTAAGAQYRQMVQVFQSYALWPHLNVFQNIAYGLKVRGWSSNAIQKRVSEMLALVNLTQDMAKMAVTSLSGGQRQRVALARALAVEPSVLLLDEPLSNLDAKVRLSVRHEIKQLQRQLGFTSVIVTHDREEALVMADRIAVMNQGKIEQVSTPEQLYHHPCSAFVADFMGADNHLELNAETLIKVLQEHSATVLPSGRYAVYFRAGSAQLLTVNQVPPSVGMVLIGEVNQCVFQGESYRHGISTQQGHCYVDHSFALPEGQCVQLFVPSTALHLFASSSVH
ncbi:ABC transporter ATP-binding protein [Celerinatantimonas yamalensis]|uniref:ABC transporter ATP-binding protein n=1 Tax=Celerinatantimonas yamalensis TaxID=559956 RepID=A0ABW9G3E4_9GAMM